LYNVPKYKVPLFPYLPTASLALNAVLMASLSWQAYMQLAVFFGIMIFVYIIYGVHAATYYEERKVPRRDAEAHKVVLDDIVDRSPSSVVRLTRASGAIKYLPPPVADE
jgi:amino acid permease